MPFELGVNLYGLTKPFTKNKQETLRQLKKIGFDCIEPMLIVMKRDSAHRPPESPPPQLWFPDTMRAEASLAGSFGLKIQSIHLAIRFREYTADYIANLLMRAYQETGAFLYVVNCAYRTCEEALGWAAFMMEIQQKLDAPVRILAHNHNMEFHPTGNPKAPYMIDLFVEAAPEIGLEVDYGWAWYAGLTMEEAKKYMTTSNWYT